MTTSYIITFIGDDRPGLVEQLSAVIENNRGNWHESRLAQLGGKFTGLVLVSLPKADGETLEAELKALADSGISVRVTPTGDSTPPAHGKRVTLSAIGPDRIGIVREISRTLAANGVNVIEMDSEVISAAMSGEMLFQTRIDAEIPDSLSINDLVDALDEIANQLTLDIDLESS